MKKLALVFTLLLFSAATILSITHFPQFKAPTPAQAQTCQDDDGVCPEGCDLESDEDCILNHARVDSTARGEVHSFSAYNYAPGIMLENGVYKMWWCGANPEGEVEDYIHYATSIDGYHWSNHQIVLSPGGPKEGVHICDPSVVKVDGKYYMYYTSDSPNNLARDNSIFLATSNDGIHWEKHPSLDSPRPVIECLEKDGDYCVGQSSVIYKDGKFWHYFSNTRGPSGDTWNIYLKTSTDGINFVDENNGEAVFGSGWGTNSVDVVYSNVLDVYFMVYGAIKDDKISWTVSKDGINWLPHDESNTLQTEATINHNPGLLTSPSGTMGTHTIAYYGAGNSDSSPWNLDATMLDISLDSFKIQGFVKNCPEETEPVLDSTEEPLECQGISGSYCFNDVVVGSHTVSLELPVDELRYDTSYSVCNNCTVNS